MSKKTLFLIILVLSVQFVNSQLKTNNNHFIENKGQIVDQNGVPNKEVLYLLNTSGLNVQIRKNGFSYDIYEKKIFDSESIKEKESKIFNPLQTDSIKRVSTKFHRIEFDFLGSNSDVKIIPTEIVKSKYNYYNLPFKEDGITDVRAYKKILYQNLYNDIDLEFFIPLDKNKPVEYNFRVHKNGKLSDIKFQVNGADVKLNDSVIEIYTVFGKLNEVIPLSWLEENEIKNEVIISFDSFGSNVFGFKNEIASLSRNSTLVIDPTPVRLWATYFGGSEEESYWGGDVESDSDGNVYIAGHTLSSTNIATIGSHQSSLISYRSGYLAKFDTDGFILWSTYYGGVGTIIRNLTIDNLNNIICVGNSGSDYIATAGSHQETKNPSKYEDGFLVKFNSNGIREWGTYYGGESSEYILSVITDVNQNIYFGGTTASNEDIATVGSFKEEGNVDVHTNWDSFLVKMDKNGVRQWATYYGGDSHDDINELGVDNFGDIYFTGTTSSFDGISTVGVYQEDYSYDSSRWKEAYLVKFTSDGIREWGSYFGGYDYEFGYGLAIDSQNNAIISGNTRSNELIASVGSYQPNKGGSQNDWDAFLAKFNQNGNLMWSTYYGGTESEDWGYFKVNIDANDNIFLIGSTRSSNNISTVGAYQENLSSYSNLFVTKFTPDGNREWGTYYGGNSSEYASAIDVTDLGEIYALGWTHSDLGVSSSGAYQEYYGGDKDALLIKFKDCESSINANVTTEVCEGESIIFEATGGISYLWNGPNGFNSSLPSLKIDDSTANLSGTYSVFVESGDGCDDTRYFEVIVSSNPTANLISNLISCEDVHNSGVSSNFDTTVIESQVLGSQTDMIVTYYDGNGNELPSPLPNPMSNNIQDVETITVRVANIENPSCYSETTFDLVVNSIPNIETIQNIETCDEDIDGFAYFDLEQVRLDIIGSQTNLDVTFYHQNGNIVLSPLSSVLNTVINQETITVNVLNTDTNCGSEATFNIIVSPLPIAYNLDEIIGCDDNEDGISEYFDTSNVESLVVGSQTDVVVTYYNNLGNQLNMVNPFTNSIPNEEIITVRVTNTLTDCYAEIALVFQTSSKPSINQPENLFACDGGDGFSYFDTSTIESQLVGSQLGLRIIYTDANGTQLTSPLPGSLQNSEPWQETIFVRVENVLNPSCFSETSFDLIVNELPEIDLESDYLLCDIEPSLYLSVDKSFSSWEWIFEDGTVVSNTFEADIYKEGTYELIVEEMNNDLLCSNTFHFNLIRSDLPIINDVRYEELSENNTIEIIVSGDGEFEYSIDDINYQNSNMFSHVMGGVYTVFVRDKNGCGQDSDEVTIIDYPNFFTPNNDGNNDYWQVFGIESFPNAKIHIYNRFGKIIHIQSSNDIGWNGYYNGELLPSSDYWFTVDLGNELEFKGHFSLIRR